MGSGESTTRKVSFGVDDEDRVRILRGVKLSEDVLQRMKGVANIPPERAQRDTGASFSASSNTRPQQNPQQTQLNTQSSTGKTTAKVKKEEQRTDRQQSILREQLAHISEAQTIKEMTRDRQHTRQEAVKTKQLAQELQKKELRLKALDAFYKEQIALIEKRNLEIYEQSKEQFHQAASKTESTVSSRNTGAVCPGLQAQVLSCYKVNGQQTLRCSDLAKEYMRCINAAKRSYLVNHG